MNKFCSLFIGILFLTHNSYAVSYSLNSENIMELQITKDGPTRINIDGEKINDIFIHPQEAAEIVVHESGCLFVLPQQGKDKVYVTIIGENGTTQDLILRFNGKKLGPIKLVSLKKEEIKTDKKDNQGNNNGCKQKSRKCRKN